MQITYDINLDVRRNGQQAKINARQYDNAARTIRAHVTDNGKPLSVLPTVKLYCKKPDGTVVYKNCTVTVTEANELIVDVTMTKQMCLVDGIVQAELQMVHSGTTLFSPRFIIEVEPSVFDENAVESTDEWSTLEDMIEDMQRISNRADSLLNAFSDHTKYPSAKAVQDIINQVQTDIGTAINILSSEAEKLENKATSLDGSFSDHSKYASAKAIKAKITEVAAALTTAIGYCEALSNKVSELSSSDTDYPTAGAVKRAIDAEAASRESQYESGTATEISLEMDSDYKVVAKLYAPDETLLSTSEAIDLPLESVVVSGEYDSTTKKVILTLEDGSTIDFSVADLISGLASTADLALKVDKVTGKGLSSNDYTDADKATLDNLDGAMATVVPKVGVLEQTVPTKLDKYTASGDADMLIVSDGAGGVEESDVSLDDKLDAYTASGNTNMILVSDGNGGVQESWQDLDYLADTGYVDNGVQDAKDYADSCQSDAETFASSEAQYAYDSACQYAGTYVDGKSSWKVLGSVTGSTEITLPSSWDELAIYVQYDTTTTDLLFIIPNTGYSRVYRTVLGYYATNSDYKVGTVEVNPTTNKLKLILYKIGINDRTSGTNVDAYYR